MYELKHISAVQLLAIAFITLAIATVVARLAMAWYQRRNIRLERVLPTHAIATWPGNAGIAFHAGSGNSYEPHRRARTARSELRSKPQ